MVTKVIALVAIALVFVVLGVIYFRLPVRTEIVKETVTLPPEVIYKTVERNVTITKTVEVPVKNYTPRVATFHGVGVYENRTSGELVNMTLIMMPGDGRLLVDTTERVFGEEIQRDMAFLRDYAVYFTGENLSHFDIVLRIDSTARLVEGVSGSGAMEVALISLIQNKSLVPNLVFTGVLEGDGSIGPVDGLDAKIVVSESLGLDKMLIPQSQCVTDKNATIQIVCVGNISAALAEMTA